MNTGTTCNVLKLQEYKAKWKLKLKHIYKS